MSATAAPADSMRLDKWLWAARFYKTRALAVEEIERGRVQVGGHAVKPAREVKPGDAVTLRQRQCISLARQPTLVSATASQSQCAAASAGQQC